MLNITLDSIYNYIKYPNFEVIVVDDWSNNLSDLDFLESHFLKDKIRVIKSSNLWVSWARNLGWSLARGNWVLFLDAHMYFYEDSLRILAELIEKYPEIDIIQPIVGNFVDKSSSGKIYKMTADLTSKWDSVMQTPHRDWIFCNPCSSWALTFCKKEVFDVLGWYNPHLRKRWVDDLEFPTRAWMFGYQCFFCDKTKVSHFYKIWYNKTTEIKSEQVLYNKIMTSYVLFQNKDRREMVLGEIYKKYWKIYLDIENQVKQDSEFQVWKQQQQRNFIYDDDRYCKKFKEYYPYLQVIDFNE